MEKAISKLRHEVTELEKLGYPRIKKRVASYNKAIEMLETMEMQPMDVYPKTKPNESFSFPVLVFDKDDPLFCEIGHFNFDTKEWTHFGEMSMDLICWCYLPNPTKHINKDWKSVKHTGYRP